MQMKWSALALAIATVVSSAAWAGGEEDAVANSELNAQKKVQGSTQSQSNGFLEDSSVSFLGRTLYMNRDFKNGAGNYNINVPTSEGFDYRANLEEALTTGNYYRLFTRPDRLKKPKGYAEEWGGSVRTFYESGFTQGTVGFGLNIYAGSAFKLDTGRGREGLGMFPRHAPGKKPEESYGQIRGAVKARLSDTTLTYGTQLPTLPVLAYDDGRLLPQTFRGTMVTSKEIDGLELSAGRFTGFTPMNQTSYTTADLKAINLVGGKYSFTDDLSASLYYADTKYVYKKKYANLNYNIPFADDESLAFDFNIYRTTYKHDYTQADKSQHNTIWSFAPKYSVGPHAFTVAYQRNTGERGYDYDLGDGGGSIFVANSYYSDFNHKDETSWQGAYDLDFSTFGVPGLAFKSAYVHSYNVDKEFYGVSGNHGTAHEWYNQLTYTVQEGFAKDLFLKARSSTYRSDFDTDVNDVRLLVEYPLDIL